MALTDTNQKIVEKNSEDQDRSLEDAELSIKKYRGSREFQDISVETLRDVDRFDLSSAAEVRSENTSMSKTETDSAAISSEHEPSDNHNKRTTVTSEKAKNDDSLENVNCEGGSTSNNTVLSEAPVEIEAMDKIQETTSVHQEILAENNSLKKKAKGGISSNEINKNKELIMSADGAPDSCVNMEEDAKFKEPVPYPSDGSASNVERRSRLHPLQIPFSSGNHCVDVTKGLLHLYKENQRTPLAEEAERSEMLCILAVPAAMTTHDLLQFTAPVNEDIEHMRIIREAKPNQYMVLIKFRNQLAADEFYKHFNGIKFNSIEPEVCHLVFVAKVETIKESEEACLPLPGHTELPTCPVCLERMDESVEGILTILCNHSFHGSCLAKWGDTSCPVCRYCQTPELTPDNRCFGCGSQESLWICLICGHVGCGRYVEGHAYHHYLDTQHTYAMQLGNNRVWDYAGDNYVHRLVQNKADGKPVELEPRWVEHEEKLDSMQLEYTYLLTSQLEAQRHYFEDRITRFEKDAHKQLEEMKEKTKHAVDERKQLEEKLCRVTKEKQGQERKINQLMSKLNKTAVELKEEKEMNKCLRQNQQAWQQRLNQTEKLLKEMKETKDKEVQELQEQVRDLMFYLEAQEKLQKMPNMSAQEIQEGQIVIGAAGGGPSEPSRQRRKKNR